MQNPPKLKSNKTSESKGRELPEWKQPLKREHINQNKFGVCYYSCEGVLGGDG
jgi:hypothetical protein